MRYSIKKNGDKWNVIVDGKVHGTFATKRLASEEVKEIQAGGHDESGKEEDENEEHGETVEMEKAELIEEHKHLIKILREGTPEEREAEAKAQEEELKEYETGEEEK